MEKYSSSPYTHEHAQHMKMRQTQNVVRSVSSKAEDWALSYLEKTEYKWTRQAIWGWRVFDFWNHQLGIAVEIDGPEHDSDYDSKRDAKNWKTSRIVVLRVKNFDEHDMQLALEAISNSDSWNERRELAGLSLITT